MTADGKESNTGFMFDPHGRVHKKFTFGKKYSQHVCGLTTANQKTGNQRGPSPAFVLLQ